MLAVLLAAGCSEQTPSERFADAKKTWATAKNTCDTYSYVRQQFFFGTENLTTVEITADVPTRRRFAQPVAPQTAFDERGAEIGSHTLGAPAQTVEQLLSGCASPSWCTTPNSCSWEITIDRRGVPLKCLAHLNGAAEDGTPGVVLTAFACASLAADGTVPN